MEKDSMDVKSDNKINLFQLRDKLFEMTDKDFENLSDEDLDKMVDELEWNDVQDLYPQNEEELEKELSKDDLREEVDLEEGLSATARIKKRMQFKSRKARTTIARNIKMRRSADMGTLQKRAKVAARRALYKKFLRGRNKSQLSASEKTQIEARISRMKNIQRNLAQKMLPKIRQIQQKRLASIRSKKK